MTAIRIGVMSDLHLDFDHRIAVKAETDQALNGAEREWWRHVRTRAERDGDHPPLGPDLRGVRDGLDVLILAGDVARGLASVAYADQAARYCRCPVVLVPGNHEYYGGDIAATRHAMVGAANETDGRVRLLDHDLDGSIRLASAQGAVAIVGATLWTDYRLNGSEDAERAKAMGDAGNILNDHKAIAKGDRGFAPEDALDIHHAARAWLGHAVGDAKGKVDRIVVVTHHAPVAEANAPEYRDGALSPAFASDLRAEIAVWQPDLWISGHTHFDHDVTIGATRCLSHQRGYLCADAQALDFAPRVVVL